jgi:hypothetical protein
LSEIAALLEKWMLSLLPVEKWQIFMAVAADIFFLLTLLALDKLLPLGLSIENWHCLL